MPLRRPFHGILLSVWNLCKLKQKAEANQIKPTNQLACCFCLLLLIVVLFLTLSGCQAVRRVRVLHGRRQEEAVRLRSGDGSGQVDVAKACLCERRAQISKNRQSHKQARLVVGRLVGSKTFGKGDLVGYGARAAFSGWSLGACGTFQSLPATKAYRKRRDGEVNSLLSAWRAEGVSAYRVCCEANRREA